MPTEFDRLHSVHIGEKSRRHDGMLVRANCTMVCAKERSDDGAMARAAGVPMIRPYDPRHTHATLLLSAGFNPKVVAERLGHSSIVQTLNVYSHVLPDMQQAAADEVERMFFAPSVAAV